MYLLSSSYSNECTQKSVQKVDSYILSLLMHGPSALPRTEIIFSWSQLVFLHFSLGFQCSSSTSHLHFKSQLTLLDRLMLLSMPSCLPRYLDFKFLTWNHDHTVLASPSQVRTLNLNSSTLGGPPASQTSSSWAWHQELWFQKTKAWQVNISMFPLLDSAYSHLLFILKIFDIRIIRI